MIRLLLCHSHQDAAAAQALAGRLELCAEARVSLAFTGPDAPDLPHLWDAEDADAVLLLLAPECVPAQLTRAAWQPVLDQLESRARPDIGAVVLRACPYPRLLGRAAFFHAGMDEPCLRALAAWLLGLHPDPGWPEWSVLHPARPSAAGGAQDLASLWSQLADSPGRSALSGASTLLLAQSFALEAAAQFRATLFLDALRRPAECVAGELAAALGVRVEGSLDDAWARIAAVLAAHRLLVILDGWEGELPWTLEAAGRSSILTLAPRSLPAAAQAPRSPLWSAALACRASGFPLALAGRIAGLAPDQALGEAARLGEQGLLAEMDPVTSRYRLLTGGEAADEIRLRHAQTLSDIFLDRERGASLAALCAAELAGALDFAASNDWHLAVRLASRAHLFFERQGRRLEAVHVLRCIIQAAVVRGDEPSAGDFRKKLSWLVDDAGAVHNLWQEGDQGSLFG